MSPPFDFKKNINLYDFRELRESPDWYFVSNVDLKYKSSIVRKADLEISSLGIVTARNSYVVWEPSYALYVPEWKSHISRCLIMDNGDPSPLEDIVNASSEEIEFLKSEQLKR